MKRTLTESLYDRLTRYSTMTLEQAIEVADSAGVDIATASPLLVAFALCKLADFARASLEPQPPSDTWEDTRARCS